MKAKRYTLSLPPKLHEELTNMAEERGVSSRDIVIKSLKLGLIALSIENKDSFLVLKETETDGSIRETKLLII